MKKTLLSLIIAFTLSITGLSAQKPADTLAADSAIKGYGLDQDSLVDINALKQSSLDETFMLKTELQTQKFLKNIFLVAFIFMTFMLILLFFIAYTKLKQIIKILKDSEREIQIRQLQIDKLSLILNNTSDAVSIADENGKIIWANKSFEKIFGFNPEEKETNIFETKDPNIKSMLDKCKKEKIPVQFTAQMTNEKGEKIWIQRKIIPFVNEKQEILNFTVIDTDYTALKLATEK